MKLNTIFEDYKKNHKCKTPDAIFSTIISDHSVETKVKIPKSVEFELSASEAKDLEADIHYAIEKVLAKFF